jgi:hypothetical protein
MLEHIMRLAKAKAYKLLHTWAATFPKLFVN